VKPRPACTGRCRLRKEAQNRGVRGALAWAEAVTDAELANLTLAIVAIN
jgi:hypothetical protein